MAKLTPRAKSKPRVVFKASRTLEQGLNKPLSPRYVLIPVATFLSGVLGFSRTDEAGDIKSKKIVPSAR